MNLRTRMKLIKHCSGQGYGDWGETMQALQQELMKYTRLVYSDVDAKRVDALVLDRFLTALGDG